MKDVTYFLSSQSKEDIKEWAEWTCAARLGELVYLEPCPRGCSLDRKAPNFKVRDLTYYRGDSGMNFYIEAQRIVYDNIREKAGRTIPRVHESLAYRLWSSIWTYGPYSRCCTSFVPWAFPSV